MNALPWLLEPDPDNPGVRYFALRDLLGRPENDPEVRQARANLMAQGTLARILAAQNPDGTWTPTGGGYQTTGTQVIFLAELGADPADERVRRAGQRGLELHLASNGGFGYGQPAVPSQVVHCHNAMLVYALLCLGFAGDARLQGALEWQARAATGDLLPGERYYKSATCGPGYACAVNLKQPCAWGATKALRAFLAVPEAQRSPAVRNAIQAGVDFLLGHDLAQADYPYTGKVSSNWFKFGFPLSYWSDVLETAEVLVELGYKDDPRLQPVLDWLRQKQDSQGRWTLEDSLNGKMWVDIEAKGQPSKWITLRALRVLKSL